MTHAINYIHIRSKNGRSLCGLAESNFEPAAETKRCPVCHQIVIKRAEIDRQYALALKNAKEMCERELAELQAEFA